MIRSNAHCHTVFCDGKNTPEEMIRAAIDRNFVSLGFSIHSWTPYEPCGVTPEKEQAYRAELLGLREKQPRSRYSKYHHSKLVQNRQIGN